jgi:hypothetical protein
MAQQESQQLSFELLKNTQQIAEQAALKAKEMAKANSPQVPQRSNDSQKAPDIPPKRLSLKKLEMENANDDMPIPVPSRNATQKIPPPIPQKPSSAQNSPRMPDKIPHSAQHPSNLLLKNQNLVQNLEQNQSNLVHNSQNLPQNSHNFMQNSLQNQNQFNLVQNYKPPPNIGQSSQPQNIVLYPQNMFHERVSQSPQLSAKNQNIVNILNSPLFQQRANQYKMQQQQPIRAQMKPDEDFGSEDALRGIERGLKNMERAMKEQMMTGKDFVDGGKDFNPVEFKRSLGGSNASLDGNNIRMMGNMRLNFDGQNWNQRGMERNISMDQMRLEAMQGGPVKGMPVEYPKNQHNIYRSLDRTLPLELQFSRHRQELQQEFLRQNNLTMQQRQQGMSREDVNLRRRSSHDETQQFILQQHKQTAGNAEQAGGMQTNLIEILMCAFISNEF